jgi:hypothetical protein
MKLRLFALLVLGTLSSFSGCCCTPQVCMPMYCHNPYWMEDLQDGYCETTAHLNASMCQMNRNLRCTLSQLHAKTECACRKQAQTRIAAAPKKNASCDSGAFELPASNCQERCTQCKQQPCRCGKCQCEGFERVGPTSPPSIFSQMLPQSDANDLPPENSIPNFPPPASINPNSEPSSVPPVQETLPAPPGPSRQGQPTPIPAPIPVPKISPSTPAPSPTAGLAPPTDPSIPLERQVRLNQIGFRKADAEKPSSAGWKPVTELPKSLQSAAGIQP